MLSERMDARLHPSLAPHRRWLGAGARAAAAAAVVALRRPPAALAGLGGRSREAHWACRRRRFPQSERSDPRQRRRNKMAAGGDPERDTGDSN